MTALSPPLLLAAAGAFVGVGVESDRSRGRLISLMLRRVGQPSHAPWSAAFVHHVGYWSHFEFAGAHSSWPLPATNDPAELEAFGRERGIVVDDPEPGDVFLLWSSAQRDHARAGIVADVEECQMYPRTRREYWVCTTIEGETTEDGAPFGGGIHMLRRNLSTAGGDRFLRWTALDARGVVADPAAKTRREGGRIVIRRAA